VKRIIIILVFAFVSVTETILGDIKNGINTSEKVSPYILEYLSRHTRSDGRWKSVVFFVNFCV